MGTTYPKKLIRHYPVVIDVLVIISLWQLSTLFFPPVVTPGIGEIWEALKVIFTDPLAFKHLATTGTRVLVALVVSFIGGAVCGFVIGLLPTLRSYIGPVLYLVQGVPALSWVVFAVIWFSNVELRILFILVVVTLPAFALYIDGAVRSVDRELVELGHAYRATKIQVLSKIIIPSVTPEMLSAWVVNIGSGIRVAVVAELIGSTVGVGFQLLNAQSVLDMAGAIAWTIALVGVLLLFQAIIAVIERYLLRWRYA